jgi:hypothetical protein
LSYLSFYLMGVHLTGFEVLRWLPVLISNSIRTVNIWNSIHLMTDLQTIENNENIRLCSFYVENMYTNIPKDDIINIISNIINKYQDISKNYQCQIIQTLKTTLEQNYFHIDNEYYKQTNGLAMGALTSVIIAETYMQHMEHTQMYPILIKQQIVGYFQYVDDISIFFFFFFFYLLLYINKNVNVRLYRFLYLRKFFTDCFEILTQRCIRIRACSHIPILYRCDLDCL